MKNCPACGAASPVHDTRDVPYSYKGRETVIAGVSGDYCDACGEIVLDREAADPCMAKIGEYQRLVNSGLVDPAYIVAVRKKLQLDQRQAGEIFGGGVNAFSRYETGKARPSISTIKLLKLLDKYPELLEEIRD
ncbi:type II toxin-antitoxin system MqsA family antitoxin [Pseudoduganella sp. UC29_106]|uniref:type II toxin-antitoxin system MqsA family antitoxin n=1 Tax=Pseudoduganella sp. UC29_106 TaxID=3374553 RepID=UPI003757E57A